MNEKTIQKLEITTEAPNPAPIVKTIITLNDKVSEVIDVLAEIDERMTFLETVNRKLELRVDALVDLSNRERNN